MNTVKKDPPFNPLDKSNLGVSVADALLAREVQPLDGIEPFIGAGIYAIYYVGDYAPYSPISQANENAEYKAPIYVGKAVPPGARKGGFGLDSEPGQVLYKRIKEHASSIKEVANLNCSDFFCRFLIVDDIWIPLGESLLIEIFSPLWNKIIDGFGIHTPGKGRGDQKRSLWDTLHEGRSRVKRHPPNDKSIETIHQELEAWFKDE